MDSFSMPSRRGVSRNALPIIQPIKHTGRHAGLPLQKLITQSIPAT
ncbi:MAG: hypothetical protein ACM3SY_21020 [Candidatus Omnitrophota bacterium]